MSEKKERKTREQMIKNREDLGRKFEEKYSDFLTVLKCMPRETREDKEQRWTYFQNYPLKNDFQTDLIDTYKPGVLAKLKVYLDSMEETKDVDRDVALFRNKGVLDFDVFFGVVEEAILNFTGIRQDGSNYSFLACIGQMYRQRAGRAAAKNELERLGISDSEIPEKNLPGIMKLFREVTDMYEKDSNTGLPEDVFEQILRQRGKQLTKRDIELLRDMFRYDITSLNKQVGDEKEDIEFINITEDVRTRIVSDEGRLMFMEYFCQRVEEGWETILLCKQLKDQEYIRIFLTKDILKELKLDGNGNPYPKEPAGDKKFYNSLKYCGVTLYGKVFYKKYLVRAFIEKPGNFYEVYVRLLRKDFNFSDKLIAQVLGKDKTTISRGGKVYKSVMGAFYKYYIDSL